MARFPSSEPYKGILADLPPARAAVARAGLQLGGRQVQPGPQPSGSAVTCKNVTPERSRDLVAARPCGIGRSEHSANTARTQLNPLRIRPVSGLLVVLSKGMFR